MNRLIKKASSFTEEELEAAGLSGIPADWPVSFDIYVEEAEVDSGWEVISDEDLILLKENNQAAYDAWVQAKRPIVQVPPASKRNAVNALVVDTSNNLGIHGANSITTISHDFCDRTTWYQRSVKVEDEILVDSGDGLTFDSANPWWIDMYSPRIVYDYNMVPERDGTFTLRSMRRPVVKVDDVVVTSGYTIDHIAGKVTFEASKTGQEVKVQYYHNNNVTRRSEWILCPPPTMAYLLDYIEIQFSKNIQFTTAMYVEIWAGGTQVGPVPDVYGDFDIETYNMGFGQNRSRYRGARDFLNVCTNRSSMVVPAFGDLDHDVLIFPFDYLIQAQIKNTDGTVIVLSLENDVPYTEAEIGTATFYMQMVPEASL